MKVLLVRQSRMLENPRPPKAKGAASNPVGRGRLIGALNLLTGRSRRWFSCRSKILRGQGALFNRRASGFHLVIVHGD
jgi:hypothetical protein